MPGAGARLLVFSIVGRLAAGLGEDREAIGDHIHAVAGLANTPGDPHEAAGCGLGQPLAELAEQGDAVRKAPVEVPTVAGRSFLLITHYDRADGPAGELTRLHQEDFAQALGVPSHRKYASEGGPTFPDCFALLRRASTRPPRDILRLLDAAIFNLIIGNADAHAKNFSLLHRGGAITLAPLYDLLSTVLYPALSAKLAMKIGEKSVLEDIEPRHWDRFAADAPLGAPFVRARVVQLCDAVVAVIDGEFAKSMWGTANFSSAKVIVRERALTHKDKF